MLKITKKAGFRKSRTQNTTKYKGARGAEALVTAFRKSRAKKQLLGNPARKAGFRKFRTQNTTKYKGA